MKKACAFSFQVFFKSAPQRNTENTQLWCNFILRLNLLEGLPDSSPINERFFICVCLFLQVCDGIYFY